MEKREALQTAKKVLLVDKQPKEIAHLGRRLEMAGLVMSFVTTGAGAIKRIEEDAPDIVLLDTALSDIDGVEVVKAIRAHPAKFRIPIIAISAFPHAKARYLDNGCDGFVEKPVKALELIAQIRGLVRKSAAAF